MQIDERETTLMYRTTMFSGRFVERTWDWYSSFAQIWLIAHEKIQDLYIEYKCSSESVRLSETFQNFIWAYDLILKGNLFPMLKTIRKCHLDINLCWSDLANFHYIQLNISLTIFITKESRPPDGPDSRPIDNC
jgi:hypothetical protein